MKQELQIGGVTVRYTLEEKNITAVLGGVYIYISPTFDELLEIVYRGLTATYGYGLSEFIYAVKKGKIRMSRKKGQYTMYDIRRLVRSRVNAINSRDVHKKRKY